MGKKDSLLFYDGDCGFCQRCVLWLQKRLAGDARLVLVSSTSASDDELIAAGLTRGQVQKSVCWSGDRVEIGAKAIARALFSCRGAWRVLGAVMSVPPISWSASIIYRVVARNRHRLPGASTSCTTPERSP